MSQPITHIQFIQTSRNRIKALVKKFEGYLKPVNQTAIIQFLKAFESEHSPTGLKLLENVDYYSNDKTSKLILPLIRAIKKKTNNTLDNVYFCPTDESSGSSTDTIIRKLRNELRLEDKTYDFMFIKNFSSLVDFSVNIEDKIYSIQGQISAIENLPDIASEMDGRKITIEQLNLEIGDLEIERIQSEEKNIIFVDDFIGSGASFVDFWEDIGPMYNEKHHYYLASLVAHKQGIEHIKANTPLDIIVATKPIPYTKKIFHDKNKIFKKEEKKIIKKYCDDMGFSKKHRYGFNNTQSLVVFYERSSNNILPILYSRKNGWPAPFPRNRFPPDEEDLGL